MKELYILGLIMGIIVLYIFFGTEIKCGATPKILINIPPIIINSRIYIGNFHLHHWLIGVLLLLICLSLHILKFRYDIIYLLYGFTNILILHGLLYQDCFDFR
jgi:hypothetical protein